MDKPAAKIRPALVAEFAFSQFCQLAAGAVRVDDAFALADAIARLRPLVDAPLSLEAPVTDAERQDAAKILRSIHGYFLSLKQNILPRPIFDGCGYVDTSEGDVLTGTTLYEIKTVDRPFRSVDIRQLVTYCALNYLSGRYMIDCIGIFNPRRGVYVVISLEEVCYEISGLSSQELFDAIVHAISSGEISR